MNPFAARKPKSSSGGRNPKRTMQMLNPFGQPVRAPPRKKAKVSASPASRRAEAEAAEETHVGWQLSTEGERWDVDKRHYPFSHFTAKYGATVALSTWGESPIFDSLAEPAEEYEEAVAQRDRFCKLRNMVDAFSESQLSRYEQFRRSSFNQRAVLEIMNEAVGAETTRGGKKKMSRSNKEMAFIMGGVAKLFVGQLVETARIVMEERKEGGAIQPWHVEESFRRLKRGNKIAFLEQNELFGGRA